MVKKNNQDKISVEQKYTYLEQIRDYTYKDVVLADTKASFALTIVAFSLAALGVLFDEIMNVDETWKNCVDFFWISGLFFSGISVFSAMLTILPRSYISHEIANDSNNWVHLHPNRWKSIKRRFLDAYYVITENFWQKQTKGTSQSLNMLINSKSNDVMVKSLYESMLRALLVQNLKFLWVGKALLFAFISFSFIVSSLFITLIVSSNNKKIIDHNTTNSQIISNIDTTKTNIKKNEIKLDRMVQIVDTSFINKKDKVYFLQIASSKSLFTQQEKNSIFKKYEHIFKHYPIYKIIEKRIKIKSNYYFCIGVELKEKDGKRLQKDLLVFYHKKSILYN
ncbi:hypothetical protein [Sulfurimonas sp.]|uniref:hypothetical protein n=1 Tax=Sulfurimonas sp. TaxID=2022749 RepID=UPI003D0EB3BF